MSGSSGKVGRGKFVHEEDGHSEEGLHSNMTTSAFRDLLDQMAAAGKRGTATTSDTGPADPKPDVGEQASRCATTSDPGPRRLSPFSMSGSGERLVIVFSRSKNEVRPLERKRARKETT